MSASPEISRVLTWDSIWVGRHPGMFMDTAGIDVEIEYTHRFHELRGLVMAQVGEIEDLLQQILHRLLNTPDQDSGSAKVVNQRRMTAGQASREVKLLLRRLGRADALESQLDLIDQAVRRRNRLVHGRIHVGTSGDPPEAVIVLLLHPDEDDGTEPHLDGDIDERMMLEVLDLARRATEAAVDIWESFTPMIEQ